MTRAGLEPGSEALVSSIVRMLRLRVTVARLVDIPVVVLDATGKVYSEGVNISNLLFYSGQVNETHSLDRITRHSVHSLYGDVGDQRLGLTFSRAGMTR